MGKRRQIQRIKTKETRLIIRDKDSDDEFFTLIAVECSGKSKLKFIVSDHDDNQFKMYMENIKRVRSTNQCVTKCVNHYKQNCMARLLISTSLKAVKNGNKFEFDKSIKRAQLTNVKNYSILPHKVSELTIDLKQNYLETKSLHSDKQ